MICMDKSHYDRIPHWLLHFIWQVYGLKASVNHAIQLHLVIKPLLVEWNVAHHINNQIPYITIVKIALGIP